MCGIQLTSRSRTGQPLVVCRAGDPANTRRPARPWTPHPGGRGARRAGGPPPLRPPGGRGPARPGKPPLRGGRRGPPRAGGRDAVVERGRVTGRGTPRPGDRRRPGGGRAEPHDRAEAAPVAGRADRGAEPSAAPRRRSRGRARLRRGGPRRAAPRRVRLPPPRIGLHVSGLAGREELLPTAVVERLSGLPGFATPERAVAALSAAAEPSRTRSLTRVAHPAHRSRTPGPVVEHPA